MLMVLDVPSGCGTSLNDVDTLVGRGLIPAFTTMAANLRISSLVGKH